jgi:hypothetical protein
MAAASASHAFTELPPAFSGKLDEISGDHVCIHLVVAGDRARVYLVRPKWADREGWEMNAVDVGAWNANRAWSLPLIV